MFILRLDGLDRLDRFFQVLELKFMKYVFRLLEIDLDFLNIYLPNQIYLSKHNQSV